MQEILKKFCDDLDSNPAYKRPWAEETEGKTYATDGKVLVEVGTFFPEFKKNPEIKYPTPSRIFNQMVPHSKALVIAEMPINQPRPKNCDNCRGTGHIGECRDCGGTGEHECDCGDRHYCQSCRGRGETNTRNDPVCQICKGTGTYDGLDYPVDCGGITFQARYIELARSIPGATVITWAKRTLPAMVTFPGGRAAIMPMDI